MRLTPRSRRRVLVRTLAVLFFLVGLIRWRFSLKMRGELEEAWQWGEQPDMAAMGGEHESNLESGWESEWSAMNHPVPTVNLVIASIARENISWTSQLAIPNMKIIQYVADDPSAPLHPSINKGNEAMVFHTYFYDFYEQLPDISILIHASEKSWHMDRILDQSLSFALANLDLEAVQERGYANLHVDWIHACPDWIDTRVTKRNKYKQEEILMRDVFLENFGSIDDRGVQTVEVPPILAQPCCSQFAVTRDAIRATPRDGYGRFIRLLEESELDNALLGRTWEHMFQWLFTARAVDCPVEWKTYCRMYGICFKTVAEYNDYKALEKWRSDLVEDLNPGLFKAGYQWVLGMTEELHREMAFVLKKIEVTRNAAMLRGRRKQQRIRRLGDLYTV